MEKYWHKDLFYFLFSKHLDISFIQLDLRHMPMSVGICTNIQLNDKCLLYL